jgi:hypothetical protein
LVQLKLAAAAGTPLVNLRHNSQQLALEYVHLQATIQDVSTIALL